MIDTVGQESYIAYKLESLMKSENFNVLHFENKDVYLGNNNLFNSQYII
jgi:hypothetical protein